MHSYSYENEFSLCLDEISFSYEKMGTKTRFEKEAKGSSKMVLKDSLLLFYFTGRLAVNDREYITWSSLILHALSAHWKSMNILKG